MPNMIKVIIDHDFFTIFRNPHHKIRLFFALNTRLIW